MIRNGILYKRYDAKFDTKKGIWKQKPEGFEPCQEPDEITGHQPGWIPVRYETRQERKENRYFKMAWDLWRLECEEQGDGFNPSNGTYELVGITINGNPEMINGLKFIPHGIHELKIYGFVLSEDLYDSLKRYFKKFKPIEGIVWHHPDGRMAKIKRIDFGLEWPVKR